MDSQFLQDYEVYRYYFGDLTINEKFKSPDILRKNGQPDTDASAMLYEWIDKKGVKRCLIKDWGYDFGGNFPLDLIMHLEDVDIKDAFKFLKHIIGQDSTGEPIRPIKVKIHRHKEAEFKIRKGYESFELRYWEKRGVTKSSLKKEDIRTLKWIKYGNKKIRSTKYNPIFIYIFKRNKKGNPISYQIYQPLCKNKKYKFRSYNIKDIIGGWDTLPKGRLDILYIVSSVKDREVIKTIPGTYAINPSGEGAWKVLFANRKMINKKAKRVVIMYDADKAGTKAAVKLSEACSWDYIDCRKRLGKYTKKEQKYTAKKWIKDWDDLRINRDWSKMDEIFSALTYKYTRKLLPF